MASRVGLGTAQFGLRYGIANTTGKVPTDDIRAILRYGAEAGVDLLDCASAYGKSEHRLGQIGVGNWKVVTKLPPEMPCDRVAAWVNEAVANSLAKLKVPKLYGLLIHRSEQLLGRTGASLYRALVELRDSGHLEKFGVSIYSPEELDRLIDTYAFDLVQAPFNVIDRRLASSGWLERLHDSGVEIHARSAFLQGLLLMDPAVRPQHFKRWRCLWVNWQRWLDQHEVSAIQACLGFVLARSEITRVIVGVDSLQQLKEVLTAAEATPIQVPDDFMQHDLDLIEPSRWAAA